MIGPDTQEASANNHGNESQRIILTPGELLSLLLLILPIIILLPGLAQFPYPSPEAPFSDFTISHYSNAIYVKSTILNFQSIPLWSPAILSGYPFAANPLSGLWYPPGWLAIVLPLPFGFNILVILHILWGGGGVYWLLRREGLAHPAALFGAISFSYLPKVFAHYGAGHITLIFAVMWTPWILVATQWNIKNENKYNRLILFSKTHNILQPGIVLALIFLADPRWSIFAVVLWFGYFIFHSVHLDLLKSQGQYVFKQLILALLLSSPLLIPMLEYTQISTRNHLSPDEILTFSLPPARLLGLIFPDFGGNHEYMVYVGGVVIPLCLILFLGHRKIIQTKFWILAASLAVIFSLGSYLPTHRIISSLPILKLMRVPSRALFISGFALICISAHSVDRLIFHLHSFNLRRGKLVLLTMIIFSLMFTGGILIISGSISKPFVWGTLMVVIGSILVWLRLEEKLKPRIWIVGLLIMVLMDGSIVNLSLFDPRPREIVLSEKNEVAQYLLGIFLTERIYSPSYSMPQHIAAMNGFELSDGVDPLQLQSYSDFMEEASGVPQRGYSVTLPPFYRGDPANDNRDFIPDPKLLGLVNVKYVLSEFDLFVDGLEIRNKIGSTRIYENLEVMPRAWVDRDGQNNDNNYSDVKEISIFPNPNKPEPKRVLSSKLSHNKLKINWLGPNRIEVLADGPGLLILSEIAYPGWHVFIDGKRADIEIMNEILRAVRIKSGSHLVEFTFQPTSVYIGCSAFILGLVAIFFWRGKGKIDILENGFNITNS